MTLPLSLACALYDRTIPLQNGTVKPEGIDLTYLELYPPEIFRRAARNAEFDVSEFSLATHALLTSRGDNRLVGLPIFPCRKFRHADICVHAGSGINEAKDLQGKRVGAIGYQQTAGVWIRGILQHEYGVDPKSIDWHFGEMNVAVSYSERIPLTLPEGIHGQNIPADRSLNQMLVSGEIDAYLGATTPNAIQERSPQVARLFPNHVEVEKDYHRRTGAFPIMHLVVIKREIYERAPWVATSLTKAFARARDHAMRRMRLGGTPFASLPWLMTHLAERDEIFGGNPFTDGLEENRATLTAFLGYAHEQGITDRLLTPEDLFVPETHTAVDPNTMEGA